MGLRPNCYKLDTVVSSAQYVAGSLRKQYANTNYGCWNILAFVRRVIVIIIINNDEFSVL